MQVRYCCALRPVGGGTFERVVFVLFKSEGSYALCSGYSGGYDLAVPDDLDCLVWQWVSYASAGAVELDGHGYDRCWGIRHQVEASDCLAGSVIGVVLS